MTISDFELGRILFLFSRHTVTQINQAQPNKQKEQKEQISYFKAQYFSNLIKNPKDNRFSKISDTESCLMMMSRNRIQIRWTKILFKDYLRLFFSGFSFKESEWVSLGWSIWRWKVNLYFCICGQRGARQWLIDPSERVLDSSKSNLPLSLSCCCILNILAFTNPT
jgi:hypothetical protein